MPKLFVANGQRIDAPFSRTVSMRRCSTIARSLVTMLDPDCAMTFRAWLSLSVGSVDDLKVFGVDIRFSVAVPGIARLVVRF